MAKKASGDRELKMGFLFGERKLATKRGIKGKTEAQPNGRIPRTKPRA
jgi:hypothetical protein